MSKITSIFWRWYWGLNSGPCLLGGYQTTFALFIFLRESCTFCPGLASDHSPPTYASLIAGITHMCYHTWHIFQMGVSLAFCSGWHQTAILQISASQVAEIIGMCHHIQLMLSFLT
jgi:hypothetical protein